ncbi:Protein of unknown function [Paenibacillus tianmuensis]|uniref:Copper amine oxidase N-terminal domain-containing protein n=1 Tax=Paenibacillus tianmuensis TaxID=624147 RepID=A0A1G4SFP3_9BACL|nr:DUF4163 domain-containing protein [Paenibacillus tianmuensis]SCW67737.1 Protein of unknown function [Paenibacillus tianmuensis]
MKTPFKLLTLSIAGACLLTAGVSGSRASAEPSSASVPVQAVPISAPVQQGAVKVSAKAVQEKTDQYSADLSIPVIEGLKDKKYQDQLNDILERHAMKDLELMKKQAANDAADAKKDGYEFNPYEVIVKYEVKAEGGATDGGMFSITVETYVYTGGAHGISRTDTYNVLNQDAAKRIELKDLFGADYKQTIDKHIKDEIAKHPDDYFKDGFEGIVDTQSFYIHQGSAVIVFAPYEIAPYSTGMPEFAIPLPNQAQTPGADARSKPHTLVVNGKKLSIIDGTVYTDAKGTVTVPLRSVAESLGYELKWNAEQQAVELQKEAQWSIVRMGKDEYVMNKMAPVSLGTAPAINSEGKMYVPLAFFSDILKADVKSEAGTITIR